MWKFYTGPSVCSDVMQHLGKGSFIYLISYFFIIFITEDEKDTFFFRNYYFWTMEPFYFLIFAAGKQAFIFHSSNRKLGELNRA